MYKLPWVEDSCLSHTCFLSVRTFSVIVSVTFCAVKRHHDKGVLQKKAFQQGSCLQLQRLSPWLSWQGIWQQAGRHGAEAVAESLLLIYKQEAERDRPVGFCKLKVHPCDTPPSSLLVLPKQSVYQDLNILIQTTTLISFEFCGVLYLYTFPVIYVSNSGHFLDLFKLLSLLITLVST